MELHMADRKLVTIERIAAINPIPEADAIEVATIRGWQVVVKKGEFVAGDECVYFEVDALLPVTDERFAFLAPRGVRTDAEGRSGHVLKTAKLRGQVSQGLALPRSTFPDPAYRHGDDVTGALGIVKWEPPIPASLAGMVAGAWPNWLSKTDEERVENIGNEQLAAWAKLYGWIATEKADGSSCSVWIDDDTDGVGSRNLNLKETEGNTLWHLARKNDLHALLRKHFSGRAAVQGEVFGEGIQGNPLKIKGQRILLFNLNVEGERLPRNQWPDEFLLMSMPRIASFAFPATAAEAVMQVQGMQSIISPGRPAEGVVWRNVNDGLLSLKAVSATYLLKHDR
jgi:RNA ligase (TIGR02306 family)